MTIIRTLRQRQAPCSDEGGFSLVELVGALTIIAVGFLALAGAASSGARLVVSGRQRQAAAETASRQLEHLRNIPFERVALSSTLAPSADPDNPDYHVSGDGLGYDHDGDGNHESLVVEAGGEVPHLETVMVGTTTLDVYHYVTWIDDAGIAGTEDYKRLVIEAVMVAPASVGVPISVRASALFTPGTVIVGGDDTDPTHGSSPGPTATPTPTGSCSGDTSPPTGSFSLASGTGAEQGYTASTTVTVALAPTDACTPITVRLSNDGSTFGSQITYDALNPSVTWTLPAGDGSKSVWAEFSDALGNAVVKGPQTIILDQTVPTQPGTLTRSVSCSGDSRTVTLSWGASSDANLVGYRVYRSIDGGEFEFLVSKTALTATDTHQKKLDSVRYRVAAYDKAGNEGPPTDEISLTKNQCS